MFKITSQSLQFCSCKLDVAYTLSLPELNVRPCLLSTMELLEKIVKILRPLTISIKDVLQNPTYATG